MSKHAPIVPPTEAERQAKVEMARGEGDLVNHFAELGRRFGANTTSKTPALKGAFSWL
ncbi:hypothetical protein GOX01_08280 [Gluconobacter oxydans]|nr:hypothetical protein EDC20_10672 [Gluconobacter oxydans]GEC60497.1 hypothetical protein GOX01_08280 [Gluconobacter oxydans]